MRELQSTNCRSKYDAGVNRDRNLPVVQIREIYRNTFYSNKPDGLSYHYQLDECIINLRCAWLKFTFVINSNWEIV